MGSASPSSPGFVHTNLGWYITDPDVRANMERGQREQGLQPEDVGAQIVHALAAPSDLQIVEIAVVSMRQTPG
jgi:NADP-dependent 3-hydroxy acid dehydrogenase YdfG